MKKIIFIIISCCTLTVAVGQRPCKILPTAQQLYEGLLYKPASAITGNFLKGCNVNDTIKKRLLYLLNWQWTEQEIDSFLKRDIKAGNEWNWIEKTAKEISKGNDSLYKAVSDSLITVYKKNRIDYIKTSPTYTTVSPGIILTAGALDIKEAIPLLRKALTDPIHYDQYSVRSALARLGDTAMQKTMYSYFVKPYKEFPNVEEATHKIARLAYIATQQSIYMVANWFDTTSKYARMLAEPPAPAEMDLVASELIKLLRTMVLNPELQAICSKYRHMAHPDFKPGDKKVIMEAKNWLLRNKGKYKINRNYYTYIY